MIRVHVNQHIIKHNVKHGTKLPTLTVKHGGDTYYAYEVTGSSARVVDCNAAGRKPLSCGARVWIEYADEGFAPLSETLTFTELEQLRAGGNA